MNREVEIEYESLRGEISDKLRLQNDLLMAAVTVSVAVLAFTFQKGDSVPWVCALPMLVLVPYARRIAYYRSAVAKTSAYIAVFIESLPESPKWETNNSSLVVDAPQHVNPKHGMPRKGLELFWLGLLYMGVFVAFSVRYVMGLVASKAPDYDLFLKAAFLILLGLLCAAGVFLLWRYSPYCHPMSEVRESWICDWKRIRLASDGCHAGLPRETMINSETQVHQSSN